MFLHSLPHSYADGVDGGRIGLAVLLGFVTFFMFDMLVRDAGGGCGGEHNNHSHSHSHDRGTARDGDDKKPNGEATPVKPIGGFFSSAVILNLAGDALHNFTDGLAVGASYATPAPSSPTAISLASIQSHFTSRGGLASLAILLHEVPHELGDFSILVSHGFSRSQAVKAQFGTAIAALLGTIVGLIAVDASENVLGTGGLVNFTSGGFIYLACCTIIPELLEEIPSRDGERGKGWRRRVAQLLAFGVGVWFMHAVAMIEHNEGDGHGHGNGHVHHHRGGGVTSDAMRGEESPIGHHHSHRSSLEHHREL